MKKKVLLISLSVVVVLILALGGIFLTAFWGIKAPRHGVVINGKVITILDGISNIFLIKTRSNNAILVDAGMTEGAGPILNTLAENGMDADSVKAVFLTHGHFDHIMGCPVFTGAEVYAMKGDVDII